MYLKNAALSKPLPVLRTVSFGRKDWGLLPGSGGPRGSQGSFFVYSRASTGTPGPLIFLELGVVPPA